MTRLLLIRHGETEWASIGKHTGHTDVPLTDRGRDEARAAADTLSEWQIDRVYSSPLRRAAETAEIVNLPHGIVFDDDLMEWDYGEYEGVKTADMRATVDPLWSIWNAPMAEGETIDAVGARVDRAIERIVHDAADSEDETTAAVFAHGHYLAIFIARWCGFAPVEGKRFKLKTATVSMLDTYREDRVIRVINHRCGAVLSDPR